MTRPHVKHLIFLSLLTGFSLILFQEVFTYDTFGPEFPLFYFYTDGLSFTQVLRTYTYNEMMWYRPTVHSLLYWVGDQFLHWHNLTGWKLFHFSTVLATAFAIYWLVLGPLGFGALAGAMAAGFFLAQPSIFAFVMEMSGFDFVYIFLALLCAGFYIHRGRASLWIAWIAFLISLTCKEVMLAMPFYLAIVSAALVFFKGARVRTELLRLAPFFALLPIYYVFHLARIPQEQFNGAYRISTDWGTIFTNIRNLSLWTTRIYGFTGETLDRPMYQSNWINNSVGLAVLLLTAAAWIVNIRRKPEWRFPGALLGMWIPMFLAIPIYSGGFIWHVNLAAAGYSALIGIAIAWWLHRIPLRGARWFALVALAGGALLLGRHNLSVELHKGTHATGFSINRNLLKSPPAPSASIPPSSLIYIEDRLRMGPWWYGCFGKLFNFVYLRHDLEEVIVPPLDDIPEDLKEKWALRKNAFFFRYDGGFRWRDGSTDLRAAITGKIAQPSNGCLGPGESGQFTEPIRVNAGGAKVSDRSGGRWLADTDFQVGQSYATGKSIQATDVPELYQSERFHTAPFEYRFCVPDGEYRIKLRFAEIWFETAGKRSFRVIINGSTVLDEFDVLKQAGGPYRALDRTFTARAVDGQLRVRFEPIVSNPKVNAIEIEPLGPAQE